MPQSVGTPKGTALVERVDRGDSSSVLNVFKGRPEGKLIWSGRSLHLSTMGSGDMAGVAMTATTGQSKSPSARTDQSRDAETSSKQPRETLADQNSGESIADGQGVLKQQNPATRPSGCRHARPALRKRRRCGNGPPGALEKASASSIRSAMRLSRTGSPMGCCSASKKPKAANGLRTQPGPIPSSLKSRRPLTDLFYTTRLAPATCRKSSTRATSCNAS